MLIEVDEPLDGLELQRCQAKSTIPIFIQTHYTSAEASMFVANLHLDWAFCDALANGISQYLETPYLRRLQHDYRPMHRGTAARLHIGQCASVIAWIRREIEHCERRSLAWQAQNNGQEGRRSRCRNMTY